MAENIKKTPLVLLFLSCTFTFTGGGGGSVCVEPMENLTMKYGLEEVFTQELVNAFLSDGRMRVTSCDASDAVLAGKITDYSKSPYAYTGEGEIREYKLEISLEIVYYTQKGDTIRKKLTEWATYPEGGEEEEGIKRVAEKVKDRIILLLLDRW